MEMNKISQTEQKNMTKEDLSHKFETFLQEMKDIKTLLEGHIKEHTKLYVEIKAIKESMESSGAIKKDRIALFVDSQNLYYSARMGYAAKVNYEKLLRLIAQERQLVKAYAYIVQPPDGDVRAFATSLERIGYIVKIKDVRTRADGSAKANWDMGIALDILGMIERVDTIVLASGDGDFAPLIEFIKGKNKRVEIFAFPENTAYDLKDKADRYEPLDENVILT